MTQASRYQGTRVAEPPTMAGQAGQGWRVRLPDTARRRAEPAVNATVGMFIVRAPGCHPFWDHWLLAVIHLRPIPGVKPADIRVAGATHELSIIALNPEQPLPSSLDAAASGWRIASGDP